MMANDDLLPELDKEIDYQDKWCDRMSFGYTTMSALAITASGAATVVTALGNTTYGAILAAVATVSFGVEKALMLREKWAHHLATKTHLRSIRLSLMYGGLDTKQTAQKMGRILESYAVGLPITPRSEAPETKRDALPSAPAVEN
jgi:hypothetical protein